MAAAEVFARIRKGPDMMTGNVVRQGDLGFNFSKRVTRQSSAIKDQEQQKIINNNDLVAGVIQDLHHGNLETLDTMETDNEVEESQPQFIVHDPTVALRPGCFKMHSGFKGKDREDALLPHLSLGTMCGRLKGCYTARLHPASATQSSFRLTTSDPLHDLKRWINTPNSSLAGQNIERMKDRFLHSDPRFTAALLRKAFLFTVSEIKSEHAEINALAEYGTRMPYCIIWQPDLTPEAELTYLENGDDEEFNTFSREALVRELTEAAVEVDYLREVRDSLSGTILRKKMRLAKLGNWGEAEKLVEQGFVDWEWVDRECFFF